MTIEDKLGLAICSILFISVMFGPRIEKDTLCVWEPYKCHPEFLDVV